MSRTSKAAKLNMITALASNEDGAALVFYNSSIPVDSEVVLQSIKLHS